MILERVKNIQEQIVRHYMSRAEGDWVRIFAHTEMDTIGGQLDSSTLSVFFVRDGDRLDEKRLKPPFAVHELLRELHAETTVRDGMWKNVILEIDPDGKFRYSFSEDYPRRLTGDLGYDAGLDEYVVEPL